MRCSKGIEAQSPTCTHSSFCAVPDPHQLAVVEAHAKLAALIVNAADVAKEKTFFMRAARPSRSRANSLSLACRTRDKPALSATKTSWGTKVFPENGEAE